MKRNIDVIALVILIAAAVNCGLIGVFRFDVMLWLFDGQSVAASRIVYVLVAVAGLWCINLIAVQGRRNHAARVTAAPALDPVRPSDPRSLKDNPSGETVCSPHFSQGCVNEDTDVLAINKGGDNNESY